MKTIYLDTSDFSRFADVGTSREQPGTAALLAELKQLRSSGLATFVFSAIHMMEIMKYSPGHNEAALRKCQIIEDLCSLNCVKYMTYIWNPEVDAALSQTVIPMTLPNNLAISADGEWFPDVIGEANSLKRDIIKQLNNGIKTHSGLSRTQRRALLRSRNLNEIFSSVENEMKEKFPISDEFYNSHMFSRFLSGQISENRLKQEMVSGIFRPTNFIDSYFEQYDKEKKLPLNLMNFSNKIIHTVEELRKKAILFPPDIKKAAFRKFDGKFLRKAAAKIYVNDLHESKKDQDKALLHILTALERKPHGSLPSVDTLGSVLTRYIWQHASSDRMPKASDAGDFLHFLYAPYVDIFRTDRYFASISRSATSTIVIGDIHKLPILIRS